MKNNERIIHFFDIRPVGVCRSEGMPDNINSAKPLPALMNDINSIRELGLARKNLGIDNASEIKLEDYREEDTYWVFMLNVVDTSAAHPVTQQIGGLETDRQVVALGGGRGLETSTHIVVMKEPTGNGTYTCLYEKNPVIPFSRAISFINHLLKLAKDRFKSSYTIPHPSGARGKTVTITSKINFLGHPSEEFLNELDGGKLTAVSIISDMSVIRGYDSNSQPELQKTRISMSIANDDIRRSGGNRRHIEKALRYGQDLNGALVKVQFKDETGQGHTADMSTDTNNLLYEEKYLMKRRIKGFTVALTTAFPIIQDVILEKMVELVED